MRVSDKWSLRSFMYKQKSRGPRTEPWGTPIFVSMQDDVVILVDTHADLPLRYDQNQSNEDFEKPTFFNFLSNSDGETLSKAFEKSN